MSSGDKLKKKKMHAKNSPRLDFSDRAALVDSTEFSEFTQVALQSADWFWAMDASLRFTYQSAGFELVTGLKRDDVLGKTREEAFAGLIDDDIKWRQLGADLLDKNPYSMVWALNHPDGKPRILHTRGLPYHDESGEFLGFRGIGNDISGYLGSQIAIEQLEGRLADFASAAADWFWELDQDLRYSYFSVDRHPVSGQPTAELIGKPLDALFTREEIVFERWDDYRELLQRRGAFEIEYQWRNPDDSLKFIEITGKPVFEGEGKFVGYRGAGRDVSESRVMADRLLRNEKQFRRIIENVSDIISVVDEDGTIRYENRAAEEILGYTLEERRQMKVGEIVHPDDMDQFMKSQEFSLAQPDVPVRTHFRVRRKDGNWRHIESTRQGLLVDKGTSLQVLVHARDVTEQRLAEDALRESEQRLRDFADTAADWFWELDVDLRYTHISDNFLLWQNLKAEDLLGKTRQEAFPNVDFSTPGWQKMLRLSEQRKPLVGCEFEMSRPDGSIRIASTTGKPIFSEDGTFMGYRGSARDVTQERNLSQQLSYQASHDSLTGLVNRREFEKRLQRILDSSESDGVEHALCFLDLDQFKLVNDACGHIAGDELLIQVSGILKLNVRKRDTIARLGGDEFGVLLERCSIVQAERVADSVRKAVDEFRFVWADKTFSIGVSIGLMTIAGQYDSLSDVLRVADSACYVAKESGRNQIHVAATGSPSLALYSADMQQIVDINAAFEENRFQLFLQPMHALQSEDKMQRGEVLVRMDKGDGTLVLPGSFLPAIERYKMAARLDSWVIERTFNHIKQHNVSTIAMEYSINLSGQSIASVEFLEFVLA
ncbi:MAG: PAS domain S-box protein, partial [Pseudomonadota bacterium]